MITFALILSAEIWQSAAEASVCARQQRLSAYSRRAVAKDFVPCCGESQEGKRVTILGKRLQCALFLTL